MENKTPKIDFAKTTGPVNPVHSTGQGPLLFGPGRLARRKRTQSVIR